ncbi:MAG: DUF952 domain-containing protein [Proteobacteria bacterium]|nr:DUF952 domain-containing protein [Pseudomonadota bacterium]
MQIYKLLHPNEYAALRTDAETLGAPVDLADGFIHFSTADQLQETARRHFSQATVLWVLGVDTGSLGDTLKWEPSRGGALFPHLYGKLLLSHIRDEREVHRAPGELWSLEDAAVDR